MSITERNNDLSLSKIGIARTQKELAAIAVMEGGLHTDPNDPGGQTCMGIARQRHPKWEGWEMVDKWQRKRASPEELKGYSALYEAIAEFYRIYLIQLSYYTISDFRTAHSYAHAGINCGDRRATRMLQSALNQLYVSVGFNTRISVDGIYGVETEEALNDIDHNNWGHFLLPLFALEWIAYYKRLCDTSVNSRRYFRGWINRVVETTTKLRKMKTTQLNFPAT